MKLALSAIFLVGCGFPDVRPGDGGGLDSTSQEGGGSEGGSDAGTNEAGDAAPVMCTMSFQCDVHCEGTLPSCKCTPFKAGDQPPFCDTTCMTACAGKMAACSEAGVCIAK